MTMEEREFSKIIAMALVQQGWTHAPSIASECIKIAKAVIAKLNEETE